MNETNTQTDDHVTQANATPPETRRRNRLTRGLVAMATIAFVTIGIGAASNRDSPANSATMAESPSGPRALPVDTIRIESVVSYQVAREYRGTIVARRVSELSFERPRLLESVQVDEGTDVAEGTPLATLDTEHLLTRRRETRARHAQAVAQLNEMITGARQEDIDAARAQVASLEAQVELLTLQTARSNRLIQSRATSQAKLEEYTFGLKARQGQLGHARHELAELINGTRREQIDAQKAIVEQLDAAIEDVDVDLRKSVLKAPFSGTIARRFTDDGTVVSTGQPILKLIEDSALEAWVGLPVAASVGVADDSAQRVRIAGRTFDARVSGRRPEVDPTTRTRTVILQLDASAADFMVHGQIVRLQLEETVVSSGFWLPTTALTKGERGLWSCLVAVPEQSPSSAEQARCRVERRDVEVLHTESERVFVRGTVSAGDQVVARGIHRISPGQIVRTSAVVQAASL